jgi:D-alanyl-D-alanine carboxypeptidase (penicillin-binding protein 5/6)
MPLLSAVALAVTLGVSPSMRPTDLPMPPVADFPVSPPPSIDAASWMVWSVESDAELGSKDPDTPRPPASITKLMTAILVVENVSLDNVVTISAEAAATPIGFVGQPEIIQGEQWTVRDLLANIMVQSGNDAAVALAEHVAGSVDAFVAMMNAKAAELGMANATFMTPNGLDTTGHEMSARDLIILGRAALQYPEILRMARIKFVVFDVGGRHIEVEATNRLLGVFPGFFGLKTGDTLNAGQTLLAYDVAQHGRLLSVVLGSSGRRIATQDLLSWARTALGPKDYFLAPLVGTDQEVSLPDWYLTWLRAAGPLPTGDPTHPPRTPLSASIDAALRHLLPALLGGGVP